MKVLVTNAKNRIAYNIVRNLAAKGLTVYCADFSQRSMAFYSQYSSGHFIYPSPFRDQEKFVECLITKIKELKIDVLIPVFEELFLVAKHKVELCKHVKIALPDYSQILTTHNKDQWEPIANQLNIPVPKTFSIEKLLLNSESLNSLPFPLLVKPKQGGGGWGIKEINSAIELRLFLVEGTHRGLPLDRFFLQEKIEGEVHCVAMVFCRGILKGKVSYKQIREYPPFSGQATCRISCANRVAEDHFHKLLRHLEWHGVCQADFVVHGVAKTPYLIDINPRFWGSLAQGIASGVDFPYLIYQIALNGDVEAVEGFKEGIVTRWLGGELRGIFHHYLASKRKLVFCREFFLPGRNAALYDDFSFNDPMPFFVWGADSIMKMILPKKFRRSQSLEGIWE